MKLKAADTIKEAEVLLEEARKILKAGNQPVLTFAGSSVGISVSPELARSIFRATEVQLNQLKKGAGYVH